MKKKSVFCAVFFFALFAAFSLTAKADGSHFLVLDAKAGQWKPSDDGAGTLTFKRVAPHLLTFSEAGQSSMRPFPLESAVKNWKKMEKKGKMLEALVALDVFEDDRDEIYLLQLSDPSYSAKKETITFKAEILSDETKVPFRLKERRIAGEIPGSFKTAALFFEQADEIIQS